MSNTSYRQILENLNTAVLVFDRQLRLTSINPAGEMLFAVSAKHVVGHVLLEFMPRGRQLIRTLQRTLVTGHPFTERGLQLPLAGPRMITVDCTVTVMTGVDAEPQLLIELNQVDRLLRLTKEENSSEQYAASRAVIRGLAHEIKNPLGGLRGAAQLLARELPNKGLQEYTRVIIHEADRLRNLVDRIIGPNLPPNKGYANIHQIFEHVRSLILAEIPEGIKIVRDYDPSLPEFFGDAEQIIQSVLNIVRNAVQAMGSQGTLYLRTRAERQFSIRQQRHRLVLRADVEDNGPGIPPELVEHIFYPMVTGRAQGMGLGLSIAQTIINQHDGLIECNSRPQKTVFTIYLPLEGGHG